MTYPQDQGYRTEKPGVADDRNLAEPADLAEPAGELTIDTDPDLIVAEVIDSDATAPVAETTNGGTNLSRQWHDIQAGFVDDPGGSVQLAADAADAALAALVSSLHAQRSSMPPGAADPAGQDTEQLRSALQQYRQFCQGIEELGRRMPQTGASVS